ncbi:MAG: hypothetical protein H6734_07330, partial [Alphaproteobacteria bacterium]|nr:hypothetical protein [Alphaproteobacteria bacterium]
DAASWLHQGGHPVLARAVFDRAMSHLDTLVDPARYEADMERFVSLDPIEPDAESIAAWSAAPTSADQLRGVADRWRQMGFADRADAVMADAAARFPDDVALYEERCRLAIRRRDGDALDALVAAPPDHPDGADNAGYYEGVFAHETGDRERAIAAFERVWARRRDWSDVARRLGTLLLEDDPRRSMEVWVQAADAHQAPYFRWLGLVGATLAEDWPAQARLGAELGLPELPDDRRVDLTWGYIRVRLPGLPRPLIAMRTGPVTARILGLLPPGEAQHHGEIVVFDPEYGNADEVEADDEVLRVHDAWAGVEPATHDCVTLDGIWPGDEAVEALTDALDEAGVHYQYGAGEGYGITDPDGGETHRGLFLLLAVDDGSAPVVRDLFEAHRPGTGPWVYHELLDRLGERDEAERHRSLARAWAMI